MAGNPSKGQKDIKKKTVKYDDSILSDSDSSVPDVDCEICGISFTNMKAYTDHVQGKKHHNRVAELKFKAKNRVEGKKELESDHDDSDDSNADMHCEVCDKYFSGYLSYASHIKGSVHAKNMKKQKLKQQLGDRPEVLNKDKSGEDSDDDAIHQKPYAKCSTCNKQFFGPESFKMHVKSSAHLRKVKQTQALQKLKGEEAKNSDDDEFYTKCDVCQKAFSGHVPYQIHMQSNVHKKAVEKKKVAEEMKEFCANSDVEAGYVCKECKKTFTDPLAFKSHLQNNSHEKRKAKEALLEFLNAYPEIIFVTPLDKEDTGNESDEPDSTYYLICKLCHTSFSGPESAQDHVKSKKHISIKREKKMLKLLKEQKNESPRSDDSKKEPLKESAVSGKQNGSTKSVNHKQGELSKGTAVNGKKKDPENSAEIIPHDFEII